MKNKYIIPTIFFILSAVFFSFNQNNSNQYLDFYSKSISNFSIKQTTLIDFINSKNISNENALIEVKKEIQQTRLQLKAADFWLRYLEPLAYKKINSPLLVEWETEVFEKHEQPYKRVGAGLTLALLYLDEEKPNKDTLLKLIIKSKKATSIFLADSIKAKMKTHDHFYFCNRLFLLNLASIYTTGFECPDTNSVIPELEFMCKSVGEIYQSFNESFPNQSLNADYLTLFDSMNQFIKNQPKNYSQFDHFTFIKNYVNPLFIINQQLILTYKASSRSNLDYALNKQAKSIFNKNLYIGQNTKGIFLRVNDEKDLALIHDLGKMLFFDPILSGNNQRSCASCHSPNQFFTDTLQKTSLQINKTDFLDRNSPSLLNAPYNHLSMLDGKHITLQHQGKAVITNPIEMGGNEIEVIEKVLSCKEYKVGFKKLLKLTPQESEITIEHIVSAITFYYGKFSNHDAPFDEAMNNKRQATANEIQGFNLYMSKSQCATCHFVPQFNGVKPPFIGSEFEVLGTPHDDKYSKVSADKGRYNVWKSAETHQAFRTGTLRNAAKTKPYMHNGVFKTLEDVIEFYNAGGGNGRGFNLENQTLSSDSLHLSKTEKTNLISFINSLTENIPLEKQPEKLPVSSNKNINTRKIGGEY